MQEDSPKAHPADPNQLKTPSNTPAALSLIWGILIFVPFVTGILAIIFSSLGRRRAVELKGVGVNASIAGLTLGVVNILFWVVAIAVWVISGREQHYVRVQGDCLNNLRALAQVARHYVDDHNGQMPRTMDDLAQYPYGAQHMICPGGAESHIAPMTSGHTFTSYVLLTPAAKYSDTRGNMVWMYEPLVPDGHHRSGLAVLTCDGQVEFLEGVRAKVFYNELLAQHNPPQLGQ